MSASLAARNLPSSSWFLSATRACSSSAASLAASHAATSLRHSSALAALVAPPASATANFVRLLSSSLARVAAVSAASSLLASAALTLGIMARYSCISPSAPALCPAAARARRLTRTAASPTRDRSSACARRGAPRSEYCPRRTHSASWNFAALISTSPRSPAAAPSFSAAATASSARLDRWVRLESMVPIELFTLSCSKSWLAEPPPSKTVCLISLKYRRRSPVMGRAASSAVAPAPPPKSCRGRRPTPVARPPPPPPAARHAGAEARSPSYERKVRSSSARDRTGWAASCPKYFSRSSRRCSTKLAPPVPPTSVPPLGDLSGRGGMK
mmetsp:Transcript_65044/g.205499  ORF Transcript_65044/g.205499 Transcript_65044/m.205499 type:complete len:329 (-) Transcript_65044:819-1805(-)